MTEITFYRDENDLYTGFECSGHSGFAKFGKDIVCAAISVLTINFVNSVDELIDGVSCDVTSNEKSGFLKVSVKDYKNSNVQLLFSSLSLGLNGIQEEYSKNLKLTNRRYNP